MSSKKFRKVKKRYDEEGNYIPPTKPKEKKKKDFVDDRDMRKHAIAACIGIFVFSIYLYDGIKNMNVPAEEQTQEIMSIVGTSFVTGLLTWSCIELGAKVYHKFRRK